MEKMGILLLIPLLILGGCTTKQDQIDDLQAQIDELRNEVDRLSYDYREDPNTIAVNLTNDNLEEYFGLVSIKRPDDRYVIAIRSLKYDEGYVIVGEEHLSLSFVIHDSDTDNKFSIAQGYYDSDYDYSGTGICSNIVKYGNTKEEYTVKALDDKLKNYSVTVTNDNAIIYYQKKEDIKYGYEMKDGERTVNGVRQLFSSYFACNPF